MRVLVPSYGRAGLATTMSLVDCAEIVVPHKQAKEYEQAYPGKVLVIPDCEDGNISKKRNACLNLLKEGELAWMLDDDLLSVDWIKHGKVDDIDQILESHHYLMESCDANFGGFSLTADPVKYFEYQPFSLTKPSYQAVCVRNIPTIRYDEELTRHEDADIFLQFLKHGGKVLRDNRYFFKFQCNADVAKVKQKGGIVGNEDAHQKALDKLVERWGECIKIKNGKMNGIKTPRSGP